MFGLISKFALDAVLFSNRLILPPKPPDDSASDVGVATAAGLAGPVPAPPLSSTAPGDPARDGISSLVAAKGA